MAAQFSLLLCAVVLSSIVSNMFVEAQFFTKSSKSIPRMGRRSEQVSNRYASLKRTLIDALLDRHWPTLLDNSYGTSKAGHEMDLTDGEIAAHYEQPQEIESSDFLGRDERTSLKPNDNGRGSNWAMRAMNIDRILQRLSSGQLGDTPSYGADKLQDLTKQQPADGSFRDRLVVVD